MKNTYFLLAMIFISFSLSITSCSSNQISVMDVSPVIKAYETDRKVSANVFDSGGEVGYINKIKAVSSSNGTLHLQSSHGSNESLKSNYYIKESDISFIEVLDQSTRLLITISLN